MRILNSHGHVDAREARYGRQVTVFPPTRRQSTSIGVLGAEYSEVATRVLAAGAAAMGITHIGSDFPGRAETSHHWFLGLLPHLVRDLNPEEADYHYLDPESPASDLCLAGMENPWIVQWANAPAAAVVSLSDLAAKFADVPTVLAVCTPTGVLVNRFHSPSAALKEIDQAAQTCRREVAPPGPPELAVLAAGLILNEVMLGAGRLRNASGSHLIGFYSLDQPRRIVTPGEASFIELMPQVFKPPAEPGATLGCQRYVLVGAGAMGTWVGLIAALEGQAQLDIYDGDTIEVHNLNRQVLFAKTGPGGNKALVLANELASMDPRGSYRSTPGYVTSASDLKHMADAGALICAPDNDATRLLCADVARENHIPYATGGSSPVGGQIVLSSPDGPCFRCVTGYRNNPGPAPDNGQSCARTLSDAVVGSNMIVAGLLMSELRATLAGRPAVNIRFQGENLSGNRLSRMVTQANCPHRVKPTIRHEGA
jgi:molybdopterin/thiamine biosynthesis adenylyltransferase